MHCGINGTSDGAAQRPLKKPRCSHYRASTNGSNIEIKFLKLNNTTRNIKFWRSTNEAKVLLALVPYQLLQQAMVLHVRRRRLNATPSYGCVLYRLLVLSLVQGAIQCLTILRTESVKRSQCAIVLQQLSRLHID